MWFFCTGANDHLYTIYDPRDDSEEDWDYWNIICRVLFCLRNYLTPHTWLHQTATGPSGTAGKVVVLESRTELDCLIEFINDEFDDPAKLRLIWWNLCWYVGFSLCSLQDSGRFNFTDYLTLTTLHHQQIRNWTEGADEPKQGNLQVAKCRHQHRLRRSHTFLDKLVWSKLFCWGHFWSCSLAPKFPGKAALSLPQPTRLASTWRLVKQQLSTGFGPSPIVIALLCWASVNLSNREIHSIRFLV